MRPDNPVVAHHFEAMGTVCGLFVIGATQSRLVEGEAWIQDLASRLTRFSADSELSRLNARAGEWVEVSADFEAVLRAALVAYETSSGLVNAAVLPSMLAAGYVHPLRDGAAAVTLERARQTSPLPEVLRVRRGTARLDRGTGVDLGGIAKGWMADRLCEVLGANAIVNLGGDLRAIGGGPSGEGWPVGVAGVTLMLRDQGAATSSTRRRRWPGAHHLIDPRSGLPADTGLEEVSVVAASGFDAEVAAKTALLLGPDLAPTWCARHAQAWWLDGRHDG